MPLVYVKNLQEPTGKNGLSFIFSSINGHRKNTFTSSWCLVLLSSSEMWFGNMCSGESEGVAPQHIPSRTHQKTRQHNHQLVNILLLTMEEKRNGRKKEILHRSLALKVFLLKDTKDMSVLNEKTPVGLNPTPLKTEGK